MEVFYQYGKGGDSVIMFDKKKFKKRTRQEKLESDNRMLTKTVAKLIELNKQLVGSPDEPSEVTEGKVMQDVQQNVTHDGLSNEESRGELSSGDNQAAEVGQCEEVISDKGREQAIRSTNFGKAIGMEDD